MNDDTLSPACSRRDVLLGGFTATVAAGLPRARLPSAHTQDLLRPPSTQDVRP